MNRLILLVATFAATSARADVIEVSPSGAISSIGYAISQAAEGDFIVVASGKYVGFTIVDKGVSIVAAPGAMVTIHGAIGVQNLAAGKTVLLDRLNVNGVSTPYVWDGHAIWLVGNAGAVRLQGCVLHGANGVWNYVTQSCHSDPQTNGFDALKVLSSTDVIATSCYAEGGLGADMYLAPDPGGGYGGTPNPPPCFGVTLTQEGGDALDIGGGSNVVLYDCSLIGGGSNKAWQKGERAGHGADVRVGSLFASNTTFLGGMGGDAANFNDGDPGCGIYIDVGGSVRLLDSMCTAGAAVGAWDPAAADIAAFGSLVSLPGEARGFLMEKALQAGGNALTYFHGAPGEVVLLLLSPTSSGSLYFPSLHGVLAFSPATMSGPYPIGSINGQGFLTTVLPVPVLPSGIDGAGIWLQTAFLAGTGSATLATPSHLTLLAPH